MLFENLSFILRAIEPADGIALMGILEGISVAYILFGFPAKAAEMGFEAWRYAALRSKNDIYLTVTEKHGEQVIGLCAYQDIDYRNGRVNIWAAASPDYENISELLKLLARSAFDHLRMEHIALPCLAEDTRMAAAAEKAGFTRDAIFYSRIKKSGKRHDLLLYTLLKEDGGGT